MTAYRKAASSQSHQRPNVEQRIAMSSILDEKVFRNSTEMDAMNLGQLLTRLMEDNFDFKSLDLPDKYMCEIDAILES